MGLFKEYLGNPEATAKTVRGQWYITGDRAYKDEDGYFWFVGRSDDVILADDLPKTISGKIKRKELIMKEFGKA